MEKKELVSVEFEIESDLYYMLKDILANTELSVEEFFENLFSYFATTPDGEEIIEAFLNEKASKELTRKVLVEVIRFPR